MQERDEKNALRLSMNSALSTPFSENINKRLHYV